MRGSFHSTCSVISSLSLLRDNQRLGILLYNARIYLQDEPAAVGRIDLVASLEELKQLVGEILDLGDRTSTLDRSTQLLGSLPELDSMAVVAIITELEERYSIVIEDDDIDAETFETLGSLLEFVNLKVAA